jgi:hypothetical protein
MHFPLTPSDALFTSQYSAQAIIGQLTQASGATGLSAMWSNFQALSENDKAFPNGGAGSGNLYNFNATPIAAELYTQGSDLQSYNFFLTSDNYLACCASSLTYNYFYLYSNQALINQTQPEQELWTNWNPVAKTNQMYYNEQGALSLATKPFSCNGDIRWYRIRE